MAKQKTTFCVNFAPSNERISMHIEGDLCVDHHLLSATTLYPTQQN